MRILVPDEKPKDVRRERARTRRYRGLLAGLVSSVLAAGFYLFPGSRPPETLYDNVDGRVHRSLLESRVDFPLSRIDVGGKIWSYRAAGQGREAIIFLHGMGGASDAWWQQMRALAPRYSVVAAEYGRVRTLDEAAAGIRATLDSEGIDRVHVVGSSLGGYLAQFFVSRYPERVSSVVLGNTFAPGSWIRREARIPGILAPVIPTWILRASFRTSIRRDVFPASGSSALVRDYLIEQSHTMTRSDFLTRIRLQHGRFDAPNIADLQIPAMIIEADNDPLVPAEPREALKAAYPESHVVTLSGVGHFPYLNRPALYTQTLEDFFASVRPHEAPHPDDSLFAPDSTAVPDSSSVRDSLTQLRQ